MIIKKGLNDGIQKQLIDKYLKSSTPNGIYLIFYFGKLKNKDLMLKKFTNHFQVHLKTK